MQAYLDTSLSINDDSLTVWGEWSRCPSVLEKGLSISIKAKFTAYPEISKSSLTLVD